MNELTLDGKDYVSSKRAAELTGYAKDYIGQMCREGRIEARLVGRNWYVLKAAVEAHRFGTTESKKEDAQPAPVAEDWQPARYHVESYSDLPAINRLDEVLEEPQESADAIEEAAPEEAEEAPASTIETMQAAWGAWFSRSEEQEEAAADSQENIDQGSEAPEEAESEEVPVAVHYAISHATRQDALNLRRIREYESRETAADVAEDALFREEVREAEGPSYLILRAAFIVVAIFSISIGYIGAGFLDKDSISFRPVSILAGVITYKQAK